MNFFDERVFKTKGKDDEDSSTESTEVSSSPYEPQALDSHAKAKPHRERSSTNSASSFKISPGLKLGSKIFTEAGLACLVTMSETEFSPEIDAIKQIKEKIDSLPPSEKEGLCIDWLSRMHPCEVGAYLRASKHGSVEEAWKNILHR